MTKSDVLHMISLALCKRDGVTPTEYVTCDNTVALFLEFSTGQVFVVEVNEREE